MTGDQRIHLPRGGLDAAAVDEDAAAVGVCAFGFAAPAHRRGDQILEPGGVEALPPAVPERGDPGREEAVAGVMDEAVAVDHAQAVAGEREVELARVEGAAAGDGEQAAAGEFAVALDEVEAPAVAA